MPAGRRAGAMLPVLLVALLGGCSASASGAGGTTSTTHGPTSSPSSTSPPAATSGASTTSPASSATTTTVGPASCGRSSLAVETGHSQAAAGTIALGFTITNTGGSCVLEGYPAVGLVPESGTVHPVVGRYGPAQAVSLPASGQAGVVLFYSDVPVDGQTTCPVMVAVKLTLPGTGGPPLTVADRLAPCGSPNLRVSAVLSSARYEGLMG